MGLRRGALAACCVSLALTFTSTAAVSADPQEIAEVRTRISQLEQQSAALSEQLNGARAQLQRSQERLGLFSRQATAARIELTGQKKTLELLARQLYVNGGVASPVLAFSLDDPDEFLSDLERLSAASTSQNGALVQAKQTAESLQATTDALAREQQRLSQATLELGELQQASSAAISELQAELAALEAEERARLEAEAAAQRSAALALTGTIAFDPASLTNQLDPAAAARIAPVLSYALAQVGKPYVWGSPGPNTFDCSGLTRAAWAQTGVSLTHYSGSQYNETAPVPVSQIRPGDLLYFYHINQHVGIYIGDGVFVHAANPRVGVVSETLNDYWQGKLVAASRPRI